MKKLLITVFVLALLIGAFFLFSGRIAVRDEIKILMENLEEKTQIDFTEIKPDEFQWNVQTEEGADSLSVLGQSFEVKEITASDYEKIETFFEENGFKPDIYNISDGTVSGSVGYKLNSIACAVSSGFVGYREAEGQWTPPITDRYETIVKCGSREGLEADYLPEVNIIEADLGENFSISLEANPTTGYDWSGVYDEEYVEFVAKRYITQSTDLVGSGGSNIFEFVARKVGETEISFSYARSWEEGSINEAVYQIIIK